jgi:putative ABC transport system permease protein
MNTALPDISALDLAWVFIPVVIVLIILLRWALDAKVAVYAIVRMLIQLLLIGYVLTYIFRTEQSLIIVAVLAVMLLAASWIALRPLQSRNRGVYFKALAAIFIGGVPVLLLVTQLVLEIEPWFLPRYMVPLAGMIFASSMNTLSLAAERLQSELDRGEGYGEARKIALNTAMIPVINSLFAVGLVSLPGMMTGQILSGVSPLVAVKYQVVVMCMIFGAAGISAATYLLLAKPGR